MIAENGTCHTQFSWCLICLFAQSCQDFPLYSWTSEPLQSKLHICGYNGALLLVFVSYSWFLSLLNGPQWRVTLSVFSAVPVHKGDEGQFWFFFLFAAFWLSRYRNTLAESSLSKPGLAECTSPSPDLHTWGLLLSSSTCLPNIYFYQTVLKEKPHNRTLKKLQLCA